MQKLPATRKVTRGVRLAAAGYIFASSSLSSIAQPADQQPKGGPPARPVIDSATAAAITAEGELKSTIRTFQGDNPSAVYRYYWWRDGCYMRDQTGNYQAVTSDYCHH